ncbi:MAG: hypothetical protein ABJQ29_04335 [Luteolibacter sp.]
MNELLQAWRKVDRNTVALLLSVIPGLGHLYKHHYTSGFFILIGGNALVVFVALLLGLATFGISVIVVPAVYYIAVAASAYAAPDRHGCHHFLHPWTPRHVHAELSRRMTDVK